MSVSPYVVAAMCGNFYWESNVNPGVWESLVPSTWDHEYQYDGIGGYGLGQWTNVGTQYGRLYNMHTWISANGYQDGDGNGQLAYIPVENVWYSGSSLGYGTLNDFLNSTSTDLYSLTYDWLVCWEGIGTDTFAARYEFAQNFLDYILVHMNDNPSDYDWISGNFYLETWQMNINAMCVYFSLNGSTPPTPPQPPQPPTPPQPPDPPSPPPVDPGIDEGDIEFSIVAGFLKKKRRIDPTYKPYTNSKT